jgi:hypothetical protein
MLLMPPYFALSLWLRACKDACLQSSMASNWHSAELSVGGISTNQSRMDQTFASGIFHNDCRAALVRNQILRLEAHASGMKLTFRS